MASWASWALPFALMRLDIVVVIHSLKVTITAMLIHYLKAEKLHTTKETVEKVLLLKIFHSYKTHL